MDTDNLVRMANRIAQFFDAMADREAALDGVAGHLRRYWAPAMRRELLDRFDAGDASAVTALHPLAAEALRTRRASLQPAEPTHRPGAPA